MTSAMGMALAKVTITTPKRGIDVALPENVTVAELLPYLLRHAGDDAPDAGESHGGWALRRPTGEQLDPKQTLGGQGVRDGEVLHLVPGQVEWPEIEYDDLVEAIASGARRYGRSWGKVATRRCGLAVGAAVLSGSALFALFFRPPWLVPGLVLLGAALVLSALGIVIARTVPDAQAGAVFAGSALPHAFVGGLLLTAPTAGGYGAFGAPQLLLASVALLVFGIAGYLGVTVLGRVFIAAVMAGLLGVIGALVGGPLEPDSAAALVLVIGIGLLPAYPLLAIRLGRLPLPQLPQRAADLLGDDPSPAAPAVFAATARADEILSGLLLGVAATAVFASMFVAGPGEVAELIMLTLVAFSLLLRARLFPVARQRIPLLVAGLVVAATLAEQFTTGAAGNLGPALALGAVASVGALIAVSGMVYSRKNPTPWFGRIADVVDVLAILALIPFAGYITGFFAYVQGLMASVG
ncbi:type VII secretion integral membrane protein EccD [Amycolatopsis acidicola]|uniref:Type VII secretion integral membrane protein EccD n=1 Tax=Amycolatopsis acidicola TaxID=2596893 RepID=A0A5N0VQK2_9PSEU|nr:type VII secretion integral membrane protein EccD [Amycolatopsis acidicola]KAA9166891.1 type VII secretion integral membrane protein EccD [Amycolatopsis acidicola]